MDDRLLKIAVCPVCKGELEDELNVLKCRQCDKQYGLDNGIAVFSNFTQENTRNKKTGRKKISVLWRDLYLVAIFILLLIFTPVVAVLCLVISIFFNKKKVIRESSRKFSGFLTRFDFNRGSRSWFNRNIFLARYRNLLKQLEYEDIMAAVDPSGDDLILDCGCGPGMYTHEFAKYAGMTVGMDINCSNVTGCTMEERASKMFVQGSMYDMPFRDGAFNKVFAGEMLIPFQKDTERTISEISRVLQKGGFLIVLNGYFFNTLNKIYMHNNTAVSFISKITKIPSDMDTLKKIWIGHLLDDPGNFMISGRSEFYEAHLSAAGFKLISNYGSISTVNEFIYSMIILIALALGKKEWKSNGNYVFLYPILRLFESLCKVKTGAFIHVYEKQAQ